MKKTMLSLAAASLVMGTAAYADVNVDLGGQAKIYYETNEADGSANDLFDQDASKASIGIQLNANADLGNGFGLGTQATILDTWGLEKNLVNNIAQNDGTGAEPTDGVLLTKVYLTKKIGNTTVKGGRQELPKALSPLAYSEGWNVFKNTMDAILVVNTDVADTTLVGAWVSSGNSVTDLSTVSHLRGGAYMLTVANKSIPMTKLTGSIYHVSHEQDTPGGAAPIDAYWVDAQIAGGDLPAGLNIGLQFGNLEADTTGSKDTTAFGVKIGAKVENVAVRAAYTSVDDGDVAVTNLSGVKSPLYTQMIFNQGDISGSQAGTNGDTSTWLVGATAGFGDAGKLIVNYSSTNIEEIVANTEADRSELDVIYKIKNNGVQYFAAYVMNDNDTANGGKLDNDKVRFWAAYAF